LIADDQRVAEVVQVLAQYLPGQVVLRDEALATSVSLGFMTCASLRRPCAR